MRRKIALALALLAVVVFAAGCGASKADVAAKNLSTEAEQFKIPRRIVVINGITDKYLLVVTGYCSLETENSALVGTLEVTCQTTEKDGTHRYYKDFIRESDNVTYTVEQLDPVNVSTSRFEVLFRPETIVPSFTR